MTGDAGTATAEVVDMEEEGHAGTEKLLPESAIIERQSSHVVRRWTLGLLLIGATLALLHTGSRSVRQEVKLESGMQELFEDNSMETTGHSNYNSGDSDRPEKITNITKPSTTTTTGTTTPSTSTTATTTSITATSVTVATTLPDGCENDEELFQGLCYKRCSLLTNGDRTMRVGPQACCRGYPCGQGGNTLMGTQFALNPCHGFNVCGDSANVHNGGCPHPPGSCHADEEQLGLFCYKTCAELTGGEYPHRTAAATCCKKQGSACMWPWNVKTDASFASGGGDSCADDEEVFQGWCYKKCSVLAGKYKYRTGAATCCTSNSTSSCMWPGNSKTSPEFDVAGGGIGCPEGEEPLGHHCYTKCATLSKGFFPFRVAAATCCRVEGIGCFWAENVVTLAEYAQGSGINPAKGIKTHTKSHHGLQR